MQYKVQIVYTDAKSPDTLISLITVEVVGVENLQNQLDSQFLSQNKDLQLKMTMRKTVIRFCKNIKSFVMKSINVQGNFVLCRVEFYKIGKRDATFIREMRVIKVRHYFFFLLFSQQTKGSGFFQLPMQKMMLTFVFVLLTLLAYLIE